MSKPIFAWSPDLGAQRQMKPSVQPTKFGDGYEVRIPNGINTMPASWTCKFTGNYALIGPAFSFLEAQAGVTSFTWTDPLNNTGTFTCAEWGIQQINFGVYELNAIFKQVFEQ